MRILAALRITGPSTASRLADLLDASSGLTSYHLRTLAAAGLVEEVARAGDRFAAYGLTTALLELPTGGLADTLGRRPVLLIATIADTGLLLALAFGTTAWHVLAGAVLGGLGRALLTGPLESWYVDTVRAVARTVPEVVAAGVRAAAGARDMRRLFGAFLLTAVAYVGVEVLWQPRFAELLGGASRATRTFG